MAILSPSPLTADDTTRPARTVHPGRAGVAAWVTEVAALTKPDRIHWCTGDASEWDLLTGQLVADGSLVRLDPGLRPNSFLARSDPRDVARVEERTFICSVDPDDAGPTNNWREPSAMKAELTDLFDGAMRGRTMYVVPFSMGPIGSPLAKLGVQITDSPYAVISMQIMTRMGTAALDEIGPDTEWVPALHSVGYPLVDASGIARADVPWPSNATKFISHFPETREIWSYGSGYGGNSLLGKKCFALRIASVLARDEGWLAEHMLLVKVTSPEGVSHNLAAAFPSACGKTNFAMMRPTIPGWKVETIGDDIAWLRPDAEGRLRAINPERGFFGVAPGTGDSTNPVAVATIWGNTVFTNVALTDDGDVWWEGLTDEAPEHLTDWRGDSWTPDSATPAAHPNSRFTAPADQCATIADEWDSPEGVVIDAIVFGGRRSTNIPLVAESIDWAHGVYMGATMSSEQTAAAEGTVGELRHDPFAMLPFCGYNMADYWAHWLEVGEQLGDRAPRIFQVNWFRKGADGSYLWPGFGENSRVVEWIARRLEDEVAALQTPAGRIPFEKDFSLEGIDLGPRDWQQLFEVDPISWLHESDLTTEHFARFGDRVPRQLLSHLSLLRWDLASRL
ncbi:phosphoenolpyruvate carboxykinase (GTP) [Amnibacterium flavum]|uniref:Phosphoenolpyruvate carboxykinase [GTP] n=1 Tax=Amnibacterium flavum TaxID=2173173 RepID=A0A2V1HSK3_9MICO|nr:phosphoenolpyruvate carboxykinase (GTP) [Amnibacterium flavum]PVZ94019.1 phosphoenolpyruvate carboxykinase (GTP) [Amnibacterium flavum]